MQAAWKAMSVLRFDRRGMVAKRGALIRLGASRLVQGKESSSRALPGVRRAPTEHVFWVVSVHRLETARRVILAGKAFQQAEGGLVGAAMREGRPFYADDTMIDEAKVLSPSSSFGDHCIIWAETVPQCPKTPISAEIFLCVKGVSVRTTATTKRPVG